MELKDCVTAAVHHHALSDGWDWAGCMDSRSFLHFSKSACLRWVKNILLMLDYWDSDQMKFKIILLMNIAFPAS